MKREEVETIFRRFGPMVFRRARALLRSDEEGRDVMQEVFIKAMAEPARFAEPEDAARWLYRVTTNLCLNHIRDTKRRSEIRRDQLTPETEPEANDLDAKIAAERILAGAEESWSQAAVLVHVDGMSYDEASKVLGVSTRTISNLLLRFRTFALEHLGEGR